MNVTESTITGKLGKKIHRQLKYNNSGTLPFGDYKVKFELTDQTRNKNPREVKVEVYDQEGYRVEMYNLDFNEI